MPLLQSTFLRARPWHALCRCAGLSLGFATLLPIWGCGERNSEAEGSEDTQADTADDEGDGGNDGADEGDGDSGDGDSGDDGNDDGDGDGGDDGASDDGDLDCDDYQARAPLRRLTRFEYNNTLRDILDDDTQPGIALPSEELGNGFGNDAEAQTSTIFLIEQYAAIGEDVGLRAVENQTLMARLAPCFAAVSEATEDDCAREFITNFVPLAYRRPLTTDEVDELLALHTGLRSDAKDFATSIASLIEAILHSPEFLYRLEFGEERSGQLKPTGHEMAVRLSYFLWGTAPDEELRQAAQEGELDDRDGILAHATRMVDDPRSRTVIQFFFDNYLPIASLSQLERDDERFPTFNSAIGAAMRRETQRFLEYEIFEGSGTWEGIFTAQHTFVNEQLAEFYGIEGVRGEEFRRVETDPNQRRGLLTHAGMMAGMTHANETSPVIRGSYVVQKLLCRPIPPPPADLLDEIVPPDPESAPTARERYAMHSEQAACAGCHAMMDPTGFALENYDAVGLWRDKENGVTIDASGGVWGTDGKASGPTELAELVAGDPDTHACFAKNWGNLVFGIDLGDDDACTKQALRKRFEDVDYNIRELLIAITQTDEFLYLPEDGRRPAN